MKIRKFSIILIVILLIASMGHAQTYVYDDMNRLVEVKYGGGAKVGFAYDKVGNRETVNEEFGLRDVIAVLEIITGIPGSGYVIADINGDSKIGLEELLYVMQRIAGLR